jgi:LmeA-like phospholipid-binding
MPDLGEQAISKVAEVGLSSQLDEVENLDVEIKTDPGKMLSGAVDSVEVHAKGMVMQKDLRVEEMQLNTNRIAINPLSAAFGKIELTQPTDAETQVVLTEADINRAFNSEFVRDKMQNLNVHVNGELATVDTQQIEFKLPGENKVLLSTNVVLEQTGEAKRVAFKAVPRVSSDGQSIALENLEYVEGKDLSPELTEALLKQASELLNLRNFKLGDMSLKLKKLEVQKGKLLLRAIAHIEQFPAT